MKLSILIVNWNTRDLAAQCIISILENAPGFAYEIIVVDNASSDGSMESLQEAYGGSAAIKLMAASANLGFAKANNLAYQNSSGEFVLMLNPDTRVKKGALQALVSFLEQNSKAGIVGPKIVNPDGTVQASVRQFPTLGSSFLVFTGLLRVFRPRQYLMDGFDYEKPGAVDQVMGAALLTRRAIIEKLGFLDENFWLWYEEVDFCKRVKNAGYEIRFFPDAAVVHHAGQSFAQLDVFARKRTVAKSLIYYFQKNGRGSDVLLLRLVLPIVLGAAWVLRLIQKFFHFRSKPHV